MGSGKDDLVLLLTVAQGPEVNQPHADLFNCDIPKIDVGWGYFSSEKSTWLTMSYFSSLALNGLLSTIRCHK